MIPDISGQEVYILGSGPTLDDHDIDSITQPCFILNSIIKYVKPKGLIFWCLLDRQEAKRHQQIPVFHWGFVSSWAAKTLEKQGFPMSRFTQWYKNSDIITKPGTVTPTTHQAIKLGISKINYIGYGGEGFAKRLGPPYSERKWTGVEQAYFPTQLETAINLCIESKINYEIL